MKPAAFLLACALVLAAPDAVEGQWSIRAGGSGAGWIGEDYSRLQVGGQLDGGIGYSVTETLLVGGSVGLGRFGYQGRGEVATLSDVGLNLTWRALRLAGGTVYGLTGAGLTWLSLSDDVEVDQSGWTTGVGAGFLLPLTEAIELDLSGRWLLQDMGNSSLDGEEIPNSGSFGSRWVLRAGILVSVGE
jgi:hypothetical protein